MLNIEDLKIGTKVHYIPFEGCEEKDYENGIVKVIPTDTTKGVFVVYNCGGEWSNYQNYTSALTSINQLGLGWE